MIQDKVINYKNSIIQHGKLNNRVYLMKLRTPKVKKVVDCIEDLARKEAYTKIFAKIPAWNWKSFEGRGYSIEAEIPRFFDGQVKALFLGKYLDPARKEPSDPKEILKVIEAARSKYANRSNVKTSFEYNIFEAGEIYAEKIANVYSQVFKTYPFPILDPDYIAETMRHDTVYFCVHETASEKIIAASSAEMDPTGSNAEMTDFAVLPEWRGKNLSGILLDFMESKMKINRIKTLYTIARAVSFGMNITFAKNGYHFGGTLINNTNISGQIESMNIWYK